MTIFCDSTEQLTEVVYGLVTKGLTFSAEPQNGGWLITLKGGF